MIDRIELKPCPCCGCEAGLHSNTEETLYGVYCPRCGMATYYEGFNTAEEAIAVWNKRYAPEPPKEESK